MAQQAPTALTWAEYLALDPKRKARCYVRDFKFYDPGEPPAPPPAAPRAPPHGCITRAAFDALSQAERDGYIKQGGMVIDG